MTHKRHEKEASRRWRSRWRRRGEGEEEEEEEEEERVKVQRVSTGSRNRSCPSERIMSGDLEQSLDDVRCATQQSPASASRTSPPRPARILLLHRLERERKHTHTKRLNTVHYSVQNLFEPAPLWEDR